MKSIITLLLVTFVSLIFFTDACTCRREPSIQRAYFKGSTKRFVKAVPVQTFEKRRTRYYLLEIQTEYKACPELLRYVLVSTEKRPAQCGVELTLNTPYVFALNKNGFFVDINNCQFIRDVSTLTSTESTFLDTRQICCDGKCTCVKNSNLICLIDPCGIPQNPPCAESVTCVPNFCGDCLAEWFNSKGLPSCPSTR